MSEKNRDKGAKNAQTLTASRIRSWSQIVVKLKIIEKLLGQFRVTGEGTNTQIEMKTFGPIVIGFQSRKLITVTGVS